MCDAPHIQPIIYALSCTMQVVQEVLCWSRNPMEVRRLCARKEEIYAKLIGNHKPPVVPGVPMFLETLVKHNVSSPLCHPQQPSGPSPCAPPG